MKNLANYELNELKALFCNIPYDIIEIVYDYYHRDKSYTVDVFAKKKHISVATLCRYIRRVNKQYEQL